MGSDLSFTITLLDCIKIMALLFLSIYSRSDSHTYTKPIISGESSYFLTEEEKQALRQAIEKIIWQDFLD